MEAIKLIAEIAEYISLIAAVLLLLVRPIREWLFGTKQVMEGQRCLLRSSMLRTYYRNREDQIIRQYEFENFMYEYKAYKALKGNSFIDHIYNEVNTWEIIS